MVGFLLTRGHPAEQKPAGVRLGNATVRVVSEVCHPPAELIATQPRHETPDRLRGPFLLRQAHGSALGRVQGRVQGNAPFLLAQDSFLAWFAASPQRQSQHLGGFRINQPLCQPSLSKAANSSSFSEIA